MKYVVASSLLDHPTKPLPRFKLILITYADPHPGYSQLFTNPAYIEALQAAGFFYIMMLDGNALFYAFTTNADELQTMLDKAFGTDYFICHEEEDVPEAYDYTEKELEDAILDIVNRFAVDIRIPWNIYRLMEAVHCADTTQFKSVINAMIDGRKLLAADNTREHVYTGSR